MLGLLASHGMLVIAFVLGVLMLGRLLRQRRSPQSALAWIAMGMLIPYVAVPLFFIIGRRKLHPKRRNPQTVGASDQASIQTLLDSYGVAPLHEGNVFRLCTTGETFHAALVELIEGAKESLQLEVFILHPDSEGREILRRLERQAAAGISVQVLLDGFGSLTTWPWHLRRLIRAGGEVAFFHSLLPPKWWMRANLRNHRKIVIADGRRCLAGGINIAREYLGPEPDPNRWTDIAFSVEGPVASAYQAIFDADWSYATEAPIPARTLAPDRVGKARLRVVPSGPDAPDDALQAIMLQSIYSARHRIWMVTPYFVPDAGLQLALAVAARRGVDVRIVVPETSNHRLADWARGPYLRDLDRQGCQIWFFQPGMLHAKALLIDDDLAMLGSANFDLRSLYLNFEVMMVIQDELSTKEVEQWTATVMKRSAAARFEAGRIRDVFEGAIRLLAPLL